MPNKYDGVDEIRNSEGTLLAPLGFGFQADWEEVGSAMPTAGAADIFFDGTLYDEIEISVVGGQTTSDNDLLDFFISDDGSTFESGASDYGYARRQHDSNGATGTEFGTTGNSSIVMASTISFDSNHAIDLTIRCKDPGNSDIQKKWTWSGAFETTDDALIHVHGSGMYSAANSAIEGIRIEMRNGNFSGLVVVRGRRKTPVSLNNQDDWVVIEDEVAISAVTTHDIFWDDQAYDEIEISAWGVVVGTDNQNFEALLSTDGSTFLNGAADYEWAFSKVDQGATVVNQGSDASGDTAVRLVNAMGTGTDEHADITVHIKNVSNTTRKKTFKWEYTGILQNGLMNHSNGGAILRDNNNSIRGFRFDAEGATTFSADRIRVRGRRITPVGVLKQDWEVLEHIELTSTQGEIEFTDIPATEFDEFELTFKDLDTDTSSNEVILQFSNDNGATYDTAGNNYHYAYTRARANGFTNINSSTANHILVSDEFGSTTVRLLHGRLNFGTLDSGSRKMVYFHNIAGTDAGFATSVDGGGLWFGTGSDGVITAFRLDLNAGGNFEAGSKFTLRGRRKQ